MWSSGLCSDLTTQQNQHNSIVGLAFKTILATAPEKIYQLMQKL